jgi:hypothetical protein
MTPPGKLLLAASASVPPPLTRSAALLSAEI